MRAKRENKLLTIKGKIGQNINNNNNAETDINDIHSGEGGNVLNVKFKLKLILCRQQPLLQFSHHVWTHTFALYTKTGCGGRKTKNHFLQN